MNRDKAMIFVFIAIALAIFFYSQTTNETARLEKDLTPIKKSIVAANRPRLIIFTAPRRPACDQFKPVVNRVIVNYSRSIDCQVLNVDDKANKEIVRIFAVQAVPATYVFNRQGNLIFKHSGYIDPDELDQYLRKTII